MSLRHRGKLELAPELASTKRHSLLQRNSVSSLMSGAASDSEQSEILSPTPRRHSTLLQQPWLHLHTTSSHTPLSSRAGSPVSVVSYASRSPLSFSSLHDHQRVRVRDPSATTNSGGLSRRLVRWMRNAGLRDWTQPALLAFALLIRWATGLGSEWYKYDLQYWGLDYPPLTAYVSWICGLVGSWIDPTWFALYDSRRIETPESKVYMRATVLVLDALIYVPATITFVRRWSSASRSQTSRHAALLILLLQPALLLVDFGHFQYNSVMLGLMIHALNAFIAEQELRGAIYFVGALCFKQMALYYAPPIFAYLFGRCIAGGRVNGTKLFIQLGVTTLVAFAIMFAPWLWPPSAILDPVTRIFPVGRGLFEDKVANFWCATDVVLKWRRRLEAPALLKLSAAATALGFLPGLILLIRAGFVAAPGTGSKAGLALLPHALFGSAMSFFLFSFQVHEKSVLLPLTPLWLAIAQGDAAVAEWGALVNNVAVFSMWSLLKRDGLATQYIALTALWNWIRDPLTKYLSIVLCVRGILILHLLELVVAPPARYPDLFAVLNVLLSAPIFALAWLWSTARLVQVSWAVGVLGGSSSRTPTSRKAADEKEKERVQSVPEE
ncbi:ALG6, ALG8 glycosyltransferase family-domain-containing protein [Auriculariales sp. MPI-PUGE-AT-0066]|nr:ALG6, ALG8 glycosyltransferase family-domain-containing protein [Auriculariales sp. MPI-PUGE-AT-0066]